MNVIAYRTPCKVWHPSWEQNSNGNVGLLIASFSDGAEDYCWVIPPGSGRPLTFRLSGIVVVEYGQV